MTTLCVFLLYMYRIGVCLHCGDLCSFHGSATLGNICVENVDMNGWMCDVFQRLHYRQS